MNMIKLFLRANLVYFFICGVPFALALMLINRDSLFYMAILLAITIVITAIFFRFSGFAKKGKTISAGLACVFFLVCFFSFSAAEFPSFAVMGAVHERFPDIAEWNIRKESGAASHQGRYTGTYIYYDMDKKKFQYDDITKDNVKDISVIVFYSHSEPKIVGVYYDTKTGKKFTDALVTDINLALVDAETKVCFAGTTLTTSVPREVKDHSQAESMVGYNSGSVRNFVYKYFKE